MFKFGNCPRFITLLTVNHAPRELYMETIAWIQSRDMVSHFDYRCLKDINSAQYFKETLHSCCCFANKTVAGIVSTFCYPLSFINVQTCISLSLIGHLGHEKIIVNNRSYTFCMTSMQNKNEYITFLLIILNFTALGFETKRSTQSNNQNK